MANIFNSRVIVHPSFVEPRLVITTAQPSGFMADLAGGQLQVRVSSIDKYVYLNRIDLRTQVSVNQASHNMLPSATITADYVSTALYLIQTRAEYNEIDVAEAGEWNVALPQAQRLAMRQGMFQYIRVANLYGVNASNNEGLLNTPNSTAVTLSPDSYGHTTIQSYDNGELALWWLGQIQAMLEAMYLLGTKVRVTIVGPQRIIGLMQMQNVVQLTSYQRPGAGTATTAQIIEKIAEENGYSVEWAYDDTLIGQGSGGGNNDAVLMVVPEIPVPEIEGISTNEFNKLTPTLESATLQYADVAAPIEITTPIPDGIDVVSRMRISSGWAPRGQAVYVLTIPF